MRETPFRGRISYVEHSNKFHFRATDSYVFQVIIGRTDSAQVLGMEEAVTRLQLAAAAGADVCFIEGVKTEELLRSTVAALAPKPVSILTLPLLTCILT